MLDDLHPGDWDLILHRRIDAGVLRGIDAIDLIRCRLDHDPVCERGMRYRSRRKQHLLQCLTPRTNRQVSINRNLGNGA